MYYKREGFEWEPYNTFVELLAQTCRKHADFVAFSWKKGRKTFEKTYKEWKEDLLLTAGKVAALEASHIGVVSDTTYESILSIFSIIVAGKVAVPLETLQSKEAVEKYVSKADIDLILYAESAMEEKPENCRVMLIDELMTLNADGLKDWPAWERDRPACIFFSSGTSGEKNAVLLSQGNIATTNAVFHGPSKPKRKTETLLFLPLYHVLAFSGVTACITGGYRIYLGKGPKYLSLELLEYQPDFIFAVPVVGELLMKGIRKEIKKSGKEEAVEKGIKLTKRLWEPLWKFGVDIRTFVFKEIYQGLGGNLRVITAGGASIRNEVVDYFDDLGIYLLTGYGMTETSGMITQNTFLKRRSGAVGIVLPYNEVKIADGEILIRGSNVMLGYYKDEEATKRVMEDGWLKTGDLGYLDEEGYLHITGRKKNLIILSNGVNVSPEEIEKELLKSQYIEEIIVREKNEHLHAEIYPGAAAGEELKKVQDGITEEIRKYNHANSVYNRIVSWELREIPFEKTSSLKIKRNT